ncbi:MAG: DUF3352 domain-containing protein [Jatrophihabitantaceae bacterium]
MTESDDRQPGQPDSGHPWFNPTSRQDWDQPPITEVTPATGGFGQDGSTAPYPAGGYAGTPYPAGGYAGTPYPAGGYAGTPYPAGGYAGTLYPAEGYQSAGYPNSGYPPTGYPPVGQPVRPARRNRLSWILGAVAAVLLLVVGGGAVAAYQVLNGGGSQPDQVVPADAVAFAKLDLNPSASQKIAAARFLHRIPKLGAGFVGSTDWRQAMFQALASDGSIPDGVDYNRDVKPWLGKRAAIAVLPTVRDGSPDVLLVFQSTDDAKARAGIARFGSNSAVSFYHGYAVVAQTQQIADQAVTSAKAANLADSDHYRSDLKQLGSIGVAAGWADLGAVGKLAGSMQASAAVFKTAGRFAFTVRMTSNSADLIGKFYGRSNATGGTPGPDLGTLPANSMVAAGMGTSAADIDRSWQQYQQLLTDAGGMFAGSDPSGQLGGTDPADLVDELQQQFGIRLPGDLKTLFGTGVMASVAVDGLAAGDTPKFAVQSRTDGAAAVRVMDRIKAAVQQDGEDFPLSYRATSTGLIVASDPAYLSTVSAAGTARLSGVAGFRQALPDRSGATASVFVNLDEIAAEMRSSGASQDDLRTMAAFSAVGLTVHVDGDSATLRVRLLAH